VTTGSISVNGPATLTNIGSGTFAANVSASGIGSTTVSAPFTITLSGGTITGTASFPGALLLGTSTTGTGSATVTGGTGSYSGATGSFPTLSGSASGSLATGFTLSFSGAGTIRTGGTGGGGGPTGPAAPTILAALDGASFSSNIAQGSVFIVKGSNLSGSGLVQASFPLPTILNNSKITFTPASGGTSTDAYMVYTCNTAQYGCVDNKTQLAAVLPSTVAPGNYNVTVTNNGTASAPFTVQVVQRKPTLITRDSSGSGLAVIQNFTSGTEYFIDSFTNAAAGTGPVKAGGVLVAWATGLGPVSGSENSASPGFNFAANGVSVQAIVGGVSITPAYAGRAPGLAGADQINFTLPANVPTGCTVPFQISVNGVLSNPTFIAIAPDAAATACVAPGFTTAQLQRFDQGGTFTVGYFGLSQITQTVPQLGTVKFNSASGTFAQFTGFQLASGGAQVAQFTPSNACEVVRTISSQGTPSAATGSVTTLDAGAVTLNGPAGSNISNLTFNKNVLTDPRNPGKSIISYSLTLASEGLPSIPGASNGTIVAGTYTVRGAGGTDVGAFNASVTLGAPLTITGGLPSTVNRSAGLTVNWTGGNASDLVQITGSSTSVTGSGASAVTDTTSFYCTTTAGAGTFTVPASILTQLPAVAASTTGASGGFLQIVSSPIPGGQNGTFTAPLTAGGSIDYGVFFGLTGIGSTVAYQ
jgi:uncharacterized protein (TIGR03437 family)